MTVAADIEPTNTATPVPQIRLTMAQKRGLLIAYHDQNGEAFGLCYGPMVALTQTHHLAKEIFHPRLPGFHIRINKRGRVVAGELESRMSPSGGTRRVLRFIRAQE